MLSTSWHHFTSLPVSKQLVVSPLPSLRNLGSCFTLCIKKGGKIRRKRFHNLSPLCSTTHLATHIQPHTRGLAHKHWATIWRNEAFRKRDGTLVNELTRLFLRSFSYPGVPPSLGQACPSLLSCDNAGGRPSPHTTLWSQTFQPPKPGDKKQFQELVLFFHYAGSGD